MSEHESITADELHAHIQGAIFGRDDGERFDQLQAKLHEIVDWYFEQDDDDDDDAGAFPQ